MHKKTRRKDTSSNLWRRRPIMLENLRSIFSKMELSKKETRILSSVFASLAKKG